MAVTRTDLKVLGNEVTCIVGSVESGVGYFYFGTNKGDIKKYNVATQAITTLLNVEGEVISMTLYSGILYIGISGGKFTQVTTY
jgi:hypothetical protein